MAQRRRAKSSSRRTFLVKQAGKAGSLSVKVPDSRIRGLLECIATKGELRLAIRSVGGTRVPRDLNAIVVVED